MVLRFYNLRVVLSVAIAGLVLLSVLSTTLVQGYMFGNYARAEAERLLRTASRGALTEVKRYLQPAEVITRHILSARAAQIIEADNLRRQELFTSFLNTIEVVPSFNSHVYSAYLGLEDGSFVSLVRSSPGLLEIADAQSTPKSAFLKLENDVTRPDGLHFWSYRNRGKWHRIARRGFDYDPRTRPWYELARASAYPVWTDVYRFSVQEGYGITLASRITGRDGQLAGVIGIDLRLEDLARFIKRLRVAESGFAFLASRDGKLIAHAGLVDREVSSTALGSGRLMLQDVHRPDEADRKLFSSLMERGSGLVEFQAAGTTFVGLRHPLSNQFGLDADLYIAAPLSDFNAAAYQALKFTLWITLGLTVLVLASGALIANAIARPVCAAAAAMKNVAELQFEHSVGMPKSHLAEIEMLNSSVGVMHHAMDGFSKYLPRDLVRDFMKLGLPIELGGARREITVLMTDIEGFSAIMESAESDELIQDLADYFDVISTTIHEHGGTVDKFIGDAVMAFWGAPRSNESHASCACDAVIALVRRLEAFNTARQARGKPTFPTRFAIHSGRAFVGNVGARERFGYTALGDVVNTAARLEKLGKAFGVQVIVSEATVRRAGSRHRFEFLGEVKPQGTSRQIGALELVAAYDDSPTTLICVPARV